MESVEDIPRDAILSGLAWDWTTYGEYLGSIDSLPKGVNVGGMVGHVALRHHVMGERGMSEEPATDDDIAAICDLVDEAIGAGALGFATSRTLLHRVPTVGRFPDLGRTIVNCSPSVTCWADRVGGSSKSHPASSEPASILNTSLARCTGWPRSSAAQVGQLRLPPHRPTWRPVCTKRF